MVKLWLWLKWGGGYSNVWKSFCYFSSSLYLPLHLKLFHRRCWVIVKCGGFQLTPNTLSTFRRCVNLVLLVFVLARQRDSVCITDFWIALMLNEGDWVRSSYSSKVKYCHILPSKLRGFLNSHCPDFIESKQWCPSLFAHFWFRPTILCGLQWRSLVAKDVHESGE